MAALTRVTGRERERKREREIMVNKRVELAHSLDAPTYVLTLKSSKVLG